MTQVESARCRLAGYAYVARFEVVLDAIERDGYLLRSDYPERKSARAGLRMGWQALTQFLRPQFLRPQSLRPVQAASEPTDAAPISLREVLQ